MSEKAIKLESVKGNQQRSSRPLIREPLMILGPEPFSGLGMPDLLLELKAKIFRIFFIWIT